MPVQAVGNDGLYDMLRSAEDKSAFCQCTLAFSAGPGAEPLLFVGRTDGQIVEPLGKGGFGWDAIFVPDGFDVTRPLRPAPSRPIAGTPCLPGRPTPLCRPWASVRPPARLPGYSCGHARLPLQASPGPLARARCRLVRWGSGQRTQSPTAPARSPSLSLTARGTTRRSRSSCRGSSRWTDRGRLMAVRPWCRVWSVAGIWAVRVAQSGGARACEWRASG